MCLESFQLRIQPKKRAFRVLNPSCQCIIALGRFLSQSNVVLQLSLCIIAIYSQKYLLVLRVS